MADILYIPSSRSVEVAKNIQIVNRYEAGRITNWVPSVEQKVIFKALERSPRTFILKARQIGASTACRLYELLLTAVNDAAGNRFFSACYVDTSEKSKKQFLETKDMARQLGVTCKINNSEYSLTFPNGSILEYNSAGSNRAGASATYHFLRLTEIPYFKPSPAEVFSSLMSTLIPGGSVVIESTLTAEDFSKGLWESKNDWKKIFFPFESHKPYRMDPDREGAYLTEEWEEKLREEGFTDRAAMEYWLHLLIDKHGGDEVRTWREYPQLCQHSWRFAEGMWIRVEPKVEKPAHIFKVKGLDREWKVEIFKDAEHNAEYCIGVDIAGGHGQDHSVVVVVDKRDSSIAACFTSADIKGDDLLEVVSQCQKYYTVPHGRSEHLPPILLESNGIGQKYYEDAINRMRAVYEVKTSEASKYEGLLEAKRKIEAGVAYGPQRLAEEARSLHSNERQKFGGQKDLCMALGFCYNHMKTYPYREPIVSLPREMFDPRRFLSHG